MMTEHLWVAIIDGVPAAIAAIGAIIGTFVSLHNSKKLDAANDKIEAVHQSTNSIVEASKKDAHALGKAEGIASMAAATPVVALPASIEVTMIPPNKPK